MPSPWRFIRSHPLPTLAILATLTGVVALVLVPLFKNPVSRANFGRIHVGMSQAEVYRLLGQPEYQSVELGLVDGPETYTINFGQTVEERRRRGFREYQREQWCASGITITVIADLDHGRVVCRYIVEGEPNWIAVLRSWLSRWF